jgi:hypothetical protein
VEKKKRVVRNTKPKKVAVWAQKGPSETQIQQAYMQWLHIQYPWARKVTFSIPNGGKRSYSYGARLKREGMTKGALDLIMCVAREGHYGVGIEFKRKGGKLRPEQKEMIAALEEQGYKAVIWDDLQRAMEETREYLGKLPRYNIEFRATIKEGIIDEISNKL